MRHVSVCASRDWCSTPQQNAVGILLVLIIICLKLVVVRLLTQRSEDEDSLEDSADNVETSRKRRRFDAAALERKRELRLWNEQR